MKVFSWMRARPRALASAGIVTIASVAITTLAFVYKGFPTTEVDLNDGGVWVTKQSSLLVGHFNHESSVLDGGLRTTSQDFDVLQAGQTVLVVDEDGDSIAPVDPAMLTLGDPADLPAGATTALGGPTVAVLSPAGELWVIAADHVGSFTAKGTHPVAKLGKGAAVAVGTDGTVFAVSVRDGEMLTTRIQPDGTVAHPSSHALDGLSKDHAVSVTAVGDTGVVLDSDDGVLYTSAGTRISLASPNGPVLQQPSGPADDVTVATSGGLLRVPLDGGDVVEVPARAEGTPAAPVVLKGCAYGAWSGSARFVRDCVGEKDDLAVDIDGLDDSSSLVFRVNRDVVVLNDVVAGTTWMASESMERVDNWSDITPPEGESDSDEDTTEESTETTLPKRSDVNTVPIAADDTFGVRPGRTTVLPVLDNDSDADGDVLVAALQGSNPSIGDISPINDGGALQIAVPDDATGSASFRYSVDDGRGGKAEATVHLDVHGWDSNAAPTQKRITSVMVEVGGTVTYNVLPDWIDPDGDDVFLSSVEPAPGDEADFTSDGRITYRAVGGTQGRKDVKIIVSDGDKVTEGTVRFDVRPLGAADAVTNADHVVALVDQVVTVSPLDNDLSTGAEPLRLARVDAVPDTSIVPDFANRTFSFSSSTPGTYYVQYLAAAGADPVPGLVRVDVLPKTDTDLPPIAVRDVALLPGGGEVLVNVLANDSDPAGGILVVQSVTMEDNSGIAVAVLDHATLRITDQAALGQQVRIGYRISNGAHTADGEVIVIPVKPPAQLRPPVANDDQAVVRVGDVVTIPVLQNDYHPNGDAIHVAPDLVAPFVDPADGQIFVSQDTLRFRATDKPGTVYATYEVVDSTGQRDAGYVTIQVLPRSDDTNTAPRPRDLSARVLSGQRVRIPVPLDGIDPEGDSVELVGLASAPQKGRIVETGADYVVYEAFADSSGLDTFTYRVRDRLGKDATAPVRVGIAPPESVNQAPYAVKDSIVMRPSRQVAVPVLANDSDPDGDDIVLLSNSIVLGDTPGLKAEVVGNRIVITAPDTPVETSLQYSIRDARGAKATAVVTISVAPDVPLSTPIARDDRVLAEDVADDGTAVLDILANDEDPDGTTTDLQIDVDSPNAHLLKDRTLKVDLTDDDQLITYTITDRDGLSASAFIRVPALSALPPTLSSTDPITVKSGQTVEIPLNDHVRVAGSGSAIVTEAAKVVAAHSNGAALVKDQHTLVYTSEDGYFGSDAITFEVTDGTGPDDPQGRKATLTLPITVLPPDNQQPSFVSGQVKIAPGEAPQELDLAALTTDPDPADLKGMGYSLVGSAPAGLTASVDGKTLKVSAATNTKKGTTATLTVRVDDGHTDPIEGTVTVEVIASTRELPTAVDDIVPEAHQGKTATVDVLANDFNPFPETPLKITAAVIETGEGANPEIVDGKIKVTPDAKFFGTMVVRYRVQDATGDPDREVEGRIRLTVQGRPDAPGRPTVSSVQDRTVVLSWTPPADNGAEIEYYTVTSAAGDYTKQYPATTCTLDGLTNNVEYTFTVVATNRVNDSDPSLPSETARPDARPDTPVPPTLVFGDRSLKVAWTTPSTPGSPVDRFNLEISPAPPSGVSQKTNVTGNSLTWDGLENGVAYQVRVQALNRAPEPSSWSTYSATTVPAAPPAAPAAPTTARLDPVPPQAQMQVSWKAPADNGDAIDVYRLKVMHGSSVVSTIDGIPGGQLSQAVAIDASTTDYTFVVAAHNKAGWGADSAASAPRRAFTAPGAPTKVSASEGDKSITVTYGAAPGNGATASELSYEYSLNGGGWSANWDGKTITGLANGTAYTVRVRAFTQLDGVRYDGAASAASNSVTPYGNPGAPSVSASASGTSITYRWSSPSTNGRAISKMEIRIDGGGWQTVSQNSSTSGSYGYSETHKIEGRVTDAAGQVSGVSSDSATTVAAPKPAAQTVKGSSAQGEDNCSSSNCRYLAMNVQNFPAGTYSVRCNDSIDGPNSWRNVSVPANGTVQLTCYFGYPGEQAWIDFQNGPVSRADPLTW